MEYNEEDFLMLSGIQHFAFCPRQWALIHIEQAWEDNFLTAHGSVLHENCHDGYSSESRGEVVLSRGMPIFSRTLGVNGECDVVEFRRGNTGIPLRDKQGFYSVYPVEYKRGEPKSDNVDALQLTAQAICLEEMLACEIHEGALFYFKTKRRQKVNITPELKDQVREVTRQMHEYFQKGYVPKIKPAKRSKACSLKNLCIPELSKIKSVKLYLQENLFEERAEQ